MFWTRLGSSVVLVVLALIFLISGGPVLGAVCLLLSLTAYCELIKACHVEKDGKFTLLEIMGGCGIVLYGAAMMLSKNFLWGIGAIVLMFHTFRQFFEHTLQHKLLYYKIVLLLP